MRVATAACRSLSVQQSAWFVILVLSPGGIWERESILLPGQGIPAPGHPGRAAETQRENSGGCHLLLLEIFLTPGVKPLSPVSAAWQADFLS